MKDVLKAFKEVDYTLPEKIQTWNLYGAGLENFGKDKQPETLPMPKYGPDELLARIDAVGICFSDIKVINQGDQHPRVVGRDLVKNPVVLGHEAAVTIVGIGENLKNDYKVGDRFIVQPDVWYGGKSMAFGYVLGGAQTQYQVIGKEIINGDEGNYLLPIQESTGYAEAALTEPWGCVVASYRIPRRPSIKSGGVMWFIGAEGNDGDYTLGVDVTSKLVLATNISGKMCDELKALAAAGKFELVETPAFNIIEISDLADKYGMFDDVVILGADADIVEKVAPYLAKHALMNIVSAEPLAKSVQIDIGKIHYMNHSYIGTTGRVIGEGYPPIRVPSELKSGGAAWFIGAGGPMGQMHVQRAVELKDGPKKIIATDIDTARLNSLKERFMPIAAQNGIVLEVVNPNEMSKEEYADMLNEFTGGKGFDDIVVLAPVPFLITTAIPFLGAEGLMNIFAGVAIGTIASLDLSGVYMRQMRIVGSSGSKLSDIKDTLDAAECGDLSTNTSVAAIGGIEAGWDGMLAAKEGKYPGKVVIYPMVHDLPLVAVPDLKDKLPNVYAKLTHGMFWNREAEAEFIKEMVKL
ncbi:MAG: alcohol dehydrogenase catalytic domain-containing protein [Armatimonadota bacterium]